MLVQIFDLIDKILKNTDKNRLANGAAVTSPNTDSNRIGTGEEKKLVHGTKAVQVQLENFDGL